MNVLRSALPHLLSGEDCRSLTSTLSNSTAHFALVWARYSCAHACAAMMFFKPYLGMEVKEHVKDYFRKSYYKSWYFGYVIVPALPELRGDVYDDANKRPVCKRQPGSPDKRWKQAMESGRRTHTCRSVERKAMIEPFFRKLWNYNWQYMSDHHVWCMWIKRLIMVGLIHVRMAHTAFLAWRLWEKFFLS